MPKAGQTPAFRAMDGAYSDNTALVSTVSTITTECSEGTRDCSSPPRIFLVNDNGGIGTCFVPPRPHSLPVADVLDV